MTNKLTAQGTPGDHLTRTLTIEELKTFYGNQLKYDGAANLEWGYDPVPVFIHAMSGSKVTFSIVNCAEFDLGEPDEHKERFEISLDDADKVQEESPSTTRSALKFDQGPKKDPRVVFLMLRPEGMAKVTSTHGRSYRQVADAQSVPDYGRGKWPMTTGGPQKLALLTQIVQHVECGGTLTPEILRQMRTSNNLPPLGPLL